MKLFRVVTQYEGDTTREGGARKTPLVQQEFKYVAEEIQQVWEAALNALCMPEEIILAIIEEAPAVVVLNPKEQNNGTHHHHA